MINQQQKKANIRTLLKKNNRALKFCILILQNTVFVHFFHKDPLFFSRKQLKHQITKTTTITTAFKQLKNIKKNLFFKLINLYFNVVYI